MKRVLVAVAAVLIAAAAPAKPPQGVPVVMQSQPGTTLDRAARQLVGDDLAAARARGDRPLLLIGAADIGAERPALFVQLQSKQECGSAGCSTAVYIWERGAYKRVLDGATGRITVSAKKTRGRADLLTDDERFLWTGSAYRSNKPAPALDLRPHPPARH